MTKKALGYDDFVGLPQPQQLELLQKEGVFVGKRKVNNLSVILYQLYGFYVEVHYTKYRKKIAHLVTSGDAEILVPYMDQIEVTGLNKNLKKD